MRAREQENKTDRPTDRKTEGRSREGEREREEREERELLPLHHDICFMRAWSCQPLGFFTHALYCCAGNREESIRGKKEGGRNRAGDRRENLKLTSCGGALPPLLLAGVSIVASLRVRDEPSPTIPTTAVVSSSCWWTLLRGVACCHAASYCLGCWFSATVFPVLKPVRTSGRRARVHDRRTALAVGCWEGRRNEGAANSFPLPAVRAAATTVPLHLSTHRRIVPAPVA